MEGKYKKYVILCGFLPFFFIQSHGEMRNGKDVIRLKSAEEKNVHNCLMDVKQRGKFIQKNSFVIKV